MWTEISYDWTINSPTTSISHGTLIRSARAILTCYWITNPLEYYLCHSCRCRLWWKRLRCHLHIQIARNRKIRQGKKADLPKVQKEILIQKPLRQLLGIEDGQLEIVMVLGTSPLLRTNAVFRVSTLADKSKLVKCLLFGKPGGPQRMLK